MSKQENLRSNLPLNGGVVELSNDWQQVGGALGSLLGQLKVTPSPAAVDQSKAVQRMQPQTSARTIAPCHTNIDKAA